MSVVYHHAADFLKH